MAQEGKTMKYGLLSFACVFVLKSIPVSAFESSVPEREEPRLRIELEAMPSPVQQDFDRYVQELATAAHKDATPEERARKADAAKQQQPKAINPIAILRW
jgi:hypothetical protein